MEHEFKLSRFPSFLRPRQDIQPMSPTIHPSLAALTAFVLSIPVSAQSPRGVEHIDTPAKKELLAKTKQAIGAQDGIYLLATPRVLVVYRSASKHEADQDAAVDEARAAAKRVDLLFDVCERFLPPHGKCGERFLVLDTAEVLKSAWKGSDGPKEHDKWSGSFAQEFARAQQFSVVGQFEYLSVWAIYEKAWFAETPPANWLTDLAIARLHSAWRVALDQEGGSKKGKAKQPEPFTKQTAREWSRLDSKEVDAALASIAPGMGAESARGESGLLPANGLVAAFLGYAQPDLKKQFLPQWAGLVSKYAERRLAGDADEAAAASALGGLDRKVLAVAAKKWAASRSK